MDKPRRQPASSPPAGASPARIDDMTRHVGWTGGEARDFAINVTPLVDVIVGIADHLHHHHSGHLGKHVPLTAAAGYDWSTQTRP